MSAIPGAVEEAELHARLDGRLPPERAAEIDAYLAAHPEARDRLSQYAEQQQGLRAAFADQTAGPIPTRLRVAWLLAEQRRHRYQRLARIAAAVVLVAAGGIGGWAARDAVPAFFPSTFPSTNARGSNARTITADAIAAYRVFSVEVRHPVEVDVSQETHLVQWLSKRLGRPLVVPDLTAAGFQLMGGRLLPAENGPAAQFMYENGKERVTLYLRTGIGGETAFRYSERNGVGAFYWSDQGFGYALAAKADRNLLLRLSEIVYQQISSDGAKAKIPPKPGKPS
jgi:anti-sigma factor RsiW